MDYFIGFLFAFIPAAIFGLVIGFIFDDGALGFVMGLGVFLLGLDILFDGSDIDPPKG